MDLKLCRATVYNGGSYNPTKRSAQPSDSKSSLGSSAPTSKPMAKSQAAVFGSEASGLNHGQGVGTDYAGPEYHHWDATPLPGGQGGSSGP